MPVTCPTCGKPYDDAVEKHTPRMVEETRGMMVIRFNSGCDVVKVEKA
jgi:hypothetical protein